MFAIVVVALGLLAAAIRAVSLKPEINLPYQRVGSLLSAGEQRFKVSLDRAIPPTTTVMVKVRLAALIIVKKTVRGADWTRAFNKIRSKEIDFVLCDKDTLEVQCALELNDSSHRYPHRQARDEDLRIVLASAGIPLIEVPVTREYDIEDIRARIAGITGGEGASRYALD